METLKTAAAPESTARALEWGVKISPSAHRKTDDLCYRVMKDVNAITVAAKEAQCGIAECKLCAGVFLERHGK